MSGIRLAFRATCWLPILLWNIGLHAQTCLVLSPVTIRADGTALLDLSLYSSPETLPAAVQWTLHYPPSSISSLTVDEGPSLTSAGKAAFCAGDADAYHCLAVGANTKTIANGVIAKLIVVLAPGTKTPAISITHSQGATASGDLIPISSKVQSAVTAKGGFDCAPHPPQPPKASLGGI